MAYQVDHQSPQIRALSDTRSLPPYIPPSSPSTKRKRDVLLYISPVSANSSFASNNSGSFVSEIGEESRVGDGASSIPEGGSNAEVKNEAPAVEDLKEEAVEIPSPRTKVANKLEGLDLSSERQKKVEGNEEQPTPPPSKASKVVKAWRKSPVGRFTGFPGLNQQHVDGNITEAMSLANEEDEQELARTPKKKKQSSVVIADQMAMSKPPDVQSTPTKRKSKAKAMFSEPAEMDMADSDETRAKDETGVDNEDKQGIDAGMVFVGSTAQLQTPSKKKLRSPPPSIAEDEEGNPQKANEDEDTDSEPETGIGYKPTPQQREIRNQKRIQQIKEYKARESREARAKRTTERRRRNVHERGASATSSTSSLLIGAASDEADEMVDVQNSSPAKKVHFAV